MRGFDDLIALTVLAAAAVVAMAGGGFYLSARKFSNHRLAGYVISMTATLAAAIIFSASLQQLWQVRRDRDARSSAARAEHLQRLHTVLREEAASLKRVGEGLREGRYFTLVADDARKAVWQDESLTPDVERHFPDYFRERERLIRDILDYDVEVGRTRESVSASLTLTAAAEPYRAMLVPALVDRCGGVSRGHASQFMAVPEAVRAFEQYPCTEQLTRRSQMLFDRAADLEDAALRASEAAERYAEETVLHGSCTYAPPE
jgi:hypothetical protein